MMHGDCRPTDPEPNESRNHPHHNPKSDQHHTGSIHMAHGSDGGHLALCRLEEIAHPPANISAPSSQHCSRASETRL
eukprot:3357012-Rhodomonas_salina.1